MEATRDLSELLEGAQFGPEEYGAVSELAFAGKESLDRMRELVHKLEVRIESGEASAPAHALKLGMCHLLLGSYETAVSWMKQAEAGAGRAHYLGQAYSSMGRHEEACREFALAAEAGWDALECSSLRAECLMLSGECEKAAALLEETRQAGEESAHWHCAYARLCQEEGKLDDAIQHYEEAMDGDSNHARSMFYLAHLLSLRGDDEGAIELYRQCSDAPFLYADALVNLAVLYEDGSDYEAAGACLRRVLSVCPDHARARLYLRDVEAAWGMFIDDQQLLEMEKHSAMLDIPVSDFELSVRSRNCLKKMNIHTLGDLMEISEAELLSYKNFGETSLREIKAMLAQKSIVLGQNAEAGETATEEGAPAITESVAEASDLTDRPVSVLQLSVRSRKCLQWLGIATVGEIMARSESQLMESRNFGQTSLNEIKDCLGKLGLSLRIVD